jgi:hypothetical protein
MENASREYSYQKVKAQIERQKAKYGWEFIFLGANIDAVEVAYSFGIDASRAQNFHSDSLGTKLNYAVMAETISHFRTNAEINEHWNEEIEADFQSR